MKGTVRRLASLGSLLALVGCEPAEQGAMVGPAPPSGDATVEIYAINYPLAWMAERIGGDAARVTLPVPEGVDPAHWQPSAETVLAYQRADIVLLNGAGYAAWTEFASLSPSRLVDTTRGLEDRFVSAGAMTHSHGPAGEHDHADIASHTWLDPDLAAGQARAIEGAMVTRVPDRADAFRQRLQSLVAELAALDQRLALAFQGWRSEGVLYSHPVYQYLDARYGLAGRSVTWEPGQDPGKGEWDALAARLAEAPAAVMLWEDEPLPATAGRLRAMGIEPVVFHTGAGPPATGDYLTLMEENLGRLARFNETVGAGDN